jgi:signal transduction histidine kinase/CheY-like chemotaxis protein/CHASE3 domain sensor protein
MRPSIGKKIAVGFLLALIALLVIGLFSSRELQQLEANSAWVDHTFQVQDKLGRLTGDLARAESGARGYGLVQDPELEASSDVAAEDARRDLNDLRNLTMDNAVQQERIDKLEPLLTQRLNVLKRMMESGNVADPNVRATAVRNGESYMVQVRQLLDEMERQESDLLAQRRIAVQTVARSTYYILVYGTVAAFCLVGITGIVVTYSITRPIGVLGIGAGKIGGGDYTHRVSIKSRDEIGELAQHFNQMAEQVQERQLALEEQDWLKTGLTRMGALFQGQRDPATVCGTVLAELASLLEARHSALYVVSDENEQPVLALQGTYAADNAPARIAPGQGLVGQCFLDQKRIQLDEVPPGYLHIHSSLGDTPPRAVVVQPALFEGEVLAVLELALLRAPTAMQLTLLDRVAESFGVVLNTIGASQRTEELLLQSQKLSAELQGRQEELNRKNRELEAQTTRLRNSELLLQEQQEELKQTNEELEQTNEELQQTNEEIEEKASLLAHQKKEAEKTSREIEQARKALQEKAEQIAQTSRYKSEFLANMSHELRTPLNSLLILSKILAENHDNNLTEKQVQYAGTIYSSGNDLLELINEVLDLSKIESGAVELEPDEVPLAEIRRFVEQTFRPVAENKNLDFQVDFDPSLPASIQTDTRRLEQVLKNLLSNAFKFTEQGAVRIRVALATSGWNPENQTLSRAPGVIAFAISDTGIGIPAEKQELIFQAFQQADAGTSRKYGGTGLGLSISREIAGLLGGTVQVESAPGQGSTFTLFVPTVFAGAPTRSTRTTAPAVQHAPAPASPPTLAVDPEGIEDDRAKLQAGDLILLIIEDDPAFAGILADFAREKGFKAVVARSVAQGVSLAGEIHPSAITLDLNLPDNDGWIVLDRLKHDPKTRHIPIHIISADEERERSLRLGAVSYFQKPVTKENLDQALSQTIEFLNRPLKNLLIVEDDATQRQALVDLIGNGDVHSTAVGTAAEAFAEMDNLRFDCLVLDLGLPDMGGIQFVREIHERYGANTPPVIVYTGRELSREEETELRMISDSIVIKNARSPERLLDETALFLHRVQTKLPEAKRRIIEQAQKNDSILAGRKVLVVDDDVRNIFAITSALEASQMQVNYAESGQAGIDYLELHPDVEVVLMDVMMPGMDGFEAIRRIRAMDRFKKLPIISVTAKAMKGDREKCLEAGASDYITKPVDMDQLRSLLRVWLYQ